MADFDHFFASDGGKWGAEPQTGEGTNAPLMPPLVIVGLEHCK